VGLFDAVEERPPSRFRRYVIILIAVIATYAAFAAMLPRLLWYPIVYHSELNTAQRFMGAVVAGNMERAYQIWKPAGSYSFQDFLDDWGPGGYYGPVKSFNVKDTDHLKASSGIEVIVQVSPYQPFPEKDDAIKQVKTKEVRLWVEFKDQSISFPLD